MVRHGPPGTATRLTTNGGGLPMKVARKTGGSGTAAVQKRERTAGWGWLLHPGVVRHGAPGTDPRLTTNGVGDPQIFSEAWVRWAVWFDTVLRRTPNRLTTNGSSASDRFGTGSPRTGQVVDDVGHEGGVEFEVDGGLADGGGEDPADDGRSGLFCRGAWRRGFGWGRCWRRWRGGRRRRGGCSGG